jgi:hypothetical protein
VGRASRLGGSPGTWGTTRRLRRVDGRDALIASRFQRAGPGAVPATHTVATVRNYCKLRRRLDRSTPQFRLTAVARFWLTAALQ